MTRLSRPKGCFGAFGDRDLGPAGGRGPCGHLGCPERLALERHLGQPGDRHVPHAERHPVLHPHLGGRLQGLAGLPGCRPVLLRRGPGPKGLRPYHLRWCSPVRNAHSKPRGERQWTAWCGRCGLRLRHPQKGVWLVVSHLHMARC